MAKDISALVRYYASLDPSKFDQDVHIGWANQLIHAYHYQIRRGEHITLGAVSIYKYSSGLNGSKLAIELVRGTLHQRFNAYEFIYTLPEGTEQGNFAVEDVRLWAIDHLQGHGTSGVGIVTSRSRLFSAEHNLTDRLLYGL